MFVREHQNQFRGAQADVQYFYGARNVTSRFSWNKPVGTSFVYIMLVGAGGPGDGATVQGGGSGAVSVWFGPAKNIPNTLHILISASSTTIRVNASASSPLTTLICNAATTTTGAAATTATGYWASGFYNFTAGNNGSATTTTSSTSFLSPGVGSGGNSTANYGYSTTGAGYFLLSPMIVGVSEAANRGTAGAYGCGSHWANIIGTPGMAIIASW